LVVVDVLSFSTAVATAVENGAIVYPCGKEEDAGSLARQWGAAVAVRREEVPDKGRYSLSPETFLSATEGERIVLQSPNGAACSRYGSRVPFLLIGALVNAATVASAVAQAVSTTGASVTVLATDRGYTGDVEYAARLNTYTSVPVMRDGIYLSR
jgi:2-phosphosulfolactate phosphatase